MTQFTGSAPRATSDPSAWQSLGEISLPVEFDPRSSSLPDLLSVVEVLRLPSARQRQVERAVCEAAGNVRDDATVEATEPVSIRVFYQGQQDLQSAQSISGETPAVHQPAGSSWGFFLISNVVADPDSTVRNRTIDLFLYPEG